MIQVAIKIDPAQLTSVTQSVRSITQALKNRDGLHRGIAKRAAQDTRDHLQKNYVHRNKRGSFWADVKKSVESVASSTEATVYLRQIGIRLRYYGGEVTPGKSISSHTGKPTRALAIPSSDVPVQKGRQIRPGRAGLLAFMRAKTYGETVGYLVEGELIKIGRGKNKGGTRIAPKKGGKILYTLRTITRHKGDPNIIPPDGKLQQGAMEAIRTFLSTYK